MKNICWVITLIYTGLLLQSCESTSSKNDLPPVLDYKQIAASIKQDTVVDLSDTANLLDSKLFNPTDSLQAYLDSIERIYTHDSALVKIAGINDSGALASIPSSDNISNPTDSFTNNIKTINVEEIKSLKYNLEQLHQNDTMQQITKNAGTCKQIECRIWAKISKKNQRMYLYVDGQLVDTFKVSTGDTKHETPVMDRRPSGPIFQKYTSKKFPGGNWNGLGNMPYVVFLSGGYGLHGTTKGNIPKLGKKASHGCIRLHPDNAKIFNELVRKVGLSNTWITIEE